MSTLTTEQIKEVLGTTNAKPRILTDEDKVQILAMVENGMKFDEIVATIKEGNEKVKKDHIRNYLTRKLGKLLKNAEEK